MQPGVRVGGEVKGAEGVALPGHVLAQQVPGAVHLQVGLQVRLLLEKETLDFKEVLILVSTFMVAISRSCSCFSWSMWKLACTCWISSTSFTCKSTLVLRRKVNKIGELVLTAGQTTQLDNLMLVHRAGWICAADPQRGMNRAVMKLFRIKLLTASLLGAQSTFTYFFIISHKLESANPTREMNGAVMKAE